MNVFQNVTLTAGSQANVQVLVGHCSHKNMHLILLIPLVWTAEGNRAP